MLGCRAKFKFDFLAIELKIFLAGFLEKLAFNWFISALLKIPREPRVMNRAPVCLPESIETKNETFNGINCIATGWGQMEMKGPLQAE